jgi:dTDP-4-dehydrorhamnose 3,5-epimerase
MTYAVTKTYFPEVIILEPKIYDDERGFFFESFNQRDFSLATGQTVNFVQDNHSKSYRGTLRGLHYQIKYPQGKLVRAISGNIFDVVVDLRRSSSSFGKWISVELSSDNKRHLWIPPGFAHGFAVISESAEVIYKTTDYWRPQYERSLLWSDPNIGIEWPFKFPPILSVKDAAGKILSEADHF